MRQWSETVGRWRVDITERIQRTGFFEPGRGPGGGPGEVVIHGLDWSISLVEDGRAKPLHTGVGTQGVRVAFRKQRKAMEVRRTWTAADDDAAARLTGWAEKVR
jgi:hypothetical protein